MKINLFYFALAGATVATIGVGFTLAQAVDPWIARFEQGPATIDVSKYPAAIQENYAAFTQKCAQCHKLSRPINSDFALPDEWSRYIHRMMSKPGSEIGNGDGKKIYDFLVLRFQRTQEDNAYTETGQTLGCGESGCGGQDKGSSR